MFYQTSNSSSEPPAWVGDAVFYQIFPDRFALSAKIHKPGPLQKWGSAPTAHGFQGGDLLGVVEHMDYLQQLGITAIYLNPVFKSASNHRYHTYDYYQVDPLLGGNSALKKLLNAAHNRGMHVILDGVFNHSGRGFWPFHHVMENGVESPYVDWFTLFGFPPNAYDSTQRPNYEAWWNLSALPKLNINNDEVREYLLKVGEYWIHFGIDGWRLDVPEEVTAEGFWQDFRRRVKKINSDAYLVGEIWQLAPEWVRGDRFDGVMNYPLSLIAMNFFAAESLRTEFRTEEYQLEALTARGALQKLTQLFESYTPIEQRGQMNILDTHDTPRFVTAAGGDYSALHLAILMQMTLPGAPSVYYGTEIGMMGARDPDCRRAFPWEASRWHHSTQNWTKAAIALRHQEKVLRHGIFVPIAGYENILAYILSGEKEDILVVFNANQKEVTAKLVLPVDHNCYRTHHDLWEVNINSDFSLRWGGGGGKDHPIALELTLPPRNARVIKLFK